MGGIIQMKIAIVEDQAEERERIKKCFQQFETEENIVLSLTFFGDGIEIVDQYAGDFDIIYFDVEMPIMDGMTAAKKIRAVDANVLIVFITNYVQWAIEGYSVNASDFLLKPVTYFNFTEHFKRIMPKLLNDNQKFLSLKTNNGIRKIRLDELIYIESEGHYLHLYTLNDKLTVLDTMKKFEQDLKEDHFFRCNNCYLVNLKHVQSVEKNIATVGNYPLQISRPRKKSFMEALTQYIGAEV